MGSRTGQAEALPNWENVSVELDEGIAWVALNRPHKRNAMNPALNAEMVDVLDTLEADDRCRVLVLTGQGEAFSAGMDLKEYFREVDEAHPSVQIKVRRVAAEWQWKRLMNYPKPTIAMVNGWCFGGAMTPLVACDLAIADEDAVFGLSEINWGIPPGSVVSRAMAASARSRDALYYIMTGETFDGRRAAEIGLVNRAVPGSALRDEVRKLADVLKEKNQVVLRAAKVGFKMARDMSWEQSEDYLYAKLEQSQHLDKERGRQAGLRQFLDDKSFRPGLSAYEREKGHEAERVEARAGARERNDVEARAGARERNDVEARAGARERNDGAPAASAGARGKRPASDRGKPRPRG